MTASVTSDVPSAPPASAVDSRAAETKLLLHELGGFARVLPLIYSSAPATIVYALGAMQNLLTRP